MKKMLILMCFLIIISPVSGSHPIAMWVFTWSPVMPCWITQNHADIKVWVTGKFSICNKTSQHSWAAGFHILPQGGTEERICYMILLLYPYLFCLFSIIFVSNQSRDFIYSFALISKSGNYTFNNFDINSSIWPCLCLERGRKFTPKANAQYPPKVIIFFWDD